MRCRTSADRPPDTSSTGTNGWQRIDMPSTFVAAPNPDLTNSGIVLGGQTLMVFGGFEVVKSNDRIMDVKPSAETWALDVRD